MSLLQRISKAHTRRYFSTCKLRRNSEKSEAQKSAPPPASNSGRLFDQERLFPVTIVEKWALVWTGKYKSVAEVPPFVLYSTVNKAKNLCRIKICHYMTGVSIVGFIIAIIVGKRAHERGDSLAKRNMEWHRQYNEAAAKNDGK